MFAKRNPRVLIGTLYSGENEFSQLQEGLARQSFTNWVHVVFKNLENKKAHDTLYRHFMERRGEFDLFLKLDADMVFRTSSSLEDLVSLFQSIPDLDHLMSPVLDWYSGLLIPALHMFSNRVVWKEDPVENLFVDPLPYIPGRRVSWREKPAPFVLHSPNPSPEQAFLFGVHRASKAIQSDRVVFNRGQATFQWRLLKAVWKRFESTRDPRLGLCLYGADLVFQGLLSHSVYVSGKINNELISSYAIPDPYAVLKKRWGSAFRRELAFYRLAGIRYLWSFLVKPPGMRRVIRRLGFLTRR